MKTSTWWIIAGVLSLLASFLAFAKPLGATLTAELIAGWGFLFVGILQLVSTFIVQGTGNKIWSILWGLLSAYLGVSLLSNPLEGILTLTYAVGLLFLATGLVRLFLAFSMRSSSAFMMLILSSIISILLGGLVLYNYPDAAPWLLGTMLAVDLLFNGIALLSLGMAGRKVETAFEG